MFSKAFFHTYIRKFLLTDTHRSLSSLDYHLWGEWYCSQVMYDERDSDDLLKYANMSIVPEITPK